MSTPHDVAAESGLASFLDPVRAWFEERFGVPTAPQAEGWPAIQRGENTLILAPTGSGKTLAAFLWGIDRLFRERMAETERVDVGAADARATDADASDGATAKRSTRAKRRRSAKQGGDQAGEADGVHLVYISPLKALNNDIYRNLRTPLAGIRLKADEMGVDLPPINVAVRSGDTPQRERRAMLREPPHILITTPESLYLLLTSPKAREMFHSVRTVIVDEIHTLAGNKRGVHLALSLERLQALADQPVQRLGLSATIQPLDEVARFLGGGEWRGEGDERRLHPRPVTVIDAGYRKPLDLEVVTVVDDLHNLSGDSIWPSLIPRVVQLIREHRTTLVFTNNRRLAERTADQLNEQIEAEFQGKATGLIEDHVVTGLGMMRGGAITHSGPIRVHHGSVAKEQRLELERQLKAGELPALVGTSSLELGIDIGSVDLIVQIESPKSVSQGLQRVGRSGHLVGQTSVGRIFPLHQEDVVEAAAIAGGMLEADVEPTYTPRHPLDVLAQQIVAMVSVQPWDVAALFDLIRCAYPYRDLTWRLLEATLGMLAGRYPSVAYRELRPRLAWDRVNQRLAALPGSRWLALTNGGTIPDTGAFGAYLADGKTKLGELDEEFVTETRIGDALMLGSQTWRVIDMTDDRVILTEAPGAVPRIPFWRGDFPWRPYELGKRVGAFRRVVSERLEAVRGELGLDAFRELRELRDTPALHSLLDWLGERYALDRSSAWHVLEYLGSQLDQVEAVSSDRTILVEVFEDALGDQRMVVHSPFGGRVNGPWGLALAQALRERTGVEIEVETNDDGVLLRILEADAAFPIDVVTSMGPEEARERILRELPDSAVFGAHFRQNAARALLLLGVGHGKRTPFWLQRLRAKDLLQVVRQFDDFPIVAETYRDCLQDVLDLPHLEEVLAGIRDGMIDVVVTESTTPSPVARSLLWNFISVRMYEWDTPRAEQQLQMLAVNRDLLQDLLKDVALDELLRPEAIEAVRSQLERTVPTAQARTMEELAVMLQQMGDLSSGEIALRSAGDPANWIARLSGQNRLVRMEIPTARGMEPRWVAAELATEYLSAFGLPGLPSGDIEQDEARRRILERYLGRTGPVTLETICARYAFPVDWLQDELDRLIEARQLVHGHFTPGAAETGPLPVGEAEFVDRRTLEQIHRRTLSILRQEVQPVPFAVYADFLAAWQHVLPGERLAGPGALSKVLQQLRAAPVVGRAWERDVLPARLAHYEPTELDALSEGGGLVWIGSGGTDPRRGRVRFLFRGEGNLYLAPAPDDLSAYDATVQEVYSFLKSEGAAFFADICAALDLDEPTAEAALIELVLASLVTNDSVEAMRRLVEEGAPQTGERRPFSSLEEELARRRDALGLGSLRAGHRPDRARFRSAKQRVRERLARQELPKSRWVGRWAAVHRFGVMGKPVDVSERVNRQARQLLVRYGIVSHECLAEEEGAWEWSLIYQELQRLEMRGEVRRGYFVQGLSGAQFALPEAVERLRAVRDNSVDDAEVVVMNACDPANLYGPSREDGPLAEGGEPFAFARVPSTWLVQRRGMPVAVASSVGANLTLVQGASDGLVQQALGALFEHLGRSEARITVETWNGEPVLETRGRVLLEAVGCYRHYPGMTWERRLR